MLALIVLATLCEVVRGQRDLAEFDSTFTQKQLRAFRFRCDPRTGRVCCPGETSFYRVLGGLPADQVEAMLLLWQEQLLGPVTDTLIAIDGKTLRHARGQELVSAIGGETGRWLGTVRVANKSNGIPAAQILIDKLDVNLTGKIVVVVVVVDDALHAQTLTAQKLLFERGADYVMTLKANQKSLYQTLETKLQSGLFSPSPDASDAHLPT